MGLCLPMPAYGPCGLGWDLPEGVIDESTLTLHQTLGALLHRTDVAQRLAACRTREFKHLPDSEFA